METAIDLSRITLKVAEYQKALSRISEKRDYWIKETKPKLIGLLSTIQKSQDQGWFVHVEEDTENMEEVHLKFRRSHGGIVDKKEHETTKRRKYGGALIFDQECNGDISVYIIYPFIEDCVDRVDDKRLDRLAPENITEAYIETQVIRFLDEMIKWEDSNSKTTIGFKWDGL